MCFGDPLWWCLGVLLLRAEVLAQGRREEKVQPTRRVKRTRQHASRVKWFLALQIPGQRDNSEIISITFVIYWLKVNADAMNDGSNRFDILLVHPL